MGLKHEVIDLIKSALVDFKRSKIRTVLTSLGITIGVLSVVMLIALGIGLKNYMKEQFEKLGANMIMVMPGSAFSNGGGLGAGGFGGGIIGGIKFDEKDYLSLTRISEAKYVVPLFMTSTTVESETGKRYGYLEGTNEVDFEAMNVEILEGELFTKADIQGRTKKAVLGYTMAEKLFGDPGDAVGQTVRASDQRFKVIGVTKKKGDPDMDDSMIIPYTTTYASINPNKNFFAIYLGVLNKDDVATVKNQAKEILLKRYKEDQFSVTEATEMLSMVDQIFSILNGVLVAIGSISLLVGGIGIMNIMYASVTERTKEVGIRRAVGATDHDILNQFLTESLLLSVFGGTIGLVTAVLIVVLVHPFFPVAVDLFSVIITLFISSAIGIFFGVFPARRAAKLSPIEAIRYE
jgi:putative ABC transport system permease protein